MSGHSLGKLLLVLAVVFCPVRAQFATTSLQNPGNVAVLTYDSARDLLIGIGPNNTTWQFDGTTWVATSSVNFPDFGDLQGIYDRSRQRTVVVNTTSGLTWEWDGADWMNAGVAPIAAFPPHLTFTGTWIYGMAYHATRQTIVMIVPNFATTHETELWEWDGAVWSLVSSPPSSGTPLSVAGPWSTYYYHALTYDARLDKLVLFGRRDMMNTNTSDGITWVWDASSGWTQLPQVFPVEETAMWFDAHRGRVLRQETFNRPTNPCTMWEFDAASGAWTSATLQGGHPLVRPSHDELRNRVYSTWGSYPLPFFYIYDTNPAAYDSHGAGCPTATPPELSLTHPWTRAWLGDTMSVDATSLPTSVALLAMGFSDQSYGATALPVDLSPLGMPGCSLRAAPEALLFASGSNNRTTFQLPIPQATALLGVVFFQQVMAPAPGANALGMLVSGSMRGTVGLR